MQWKGIFRSKIHHIPFNDGQKWCCWIQRSYGFIASNDDFLTSYTANSLISRRIYSTTQFRAKHFHLLKKSTQLNICFDCLSLSKIYIENVSVLLKYLFLSRLLQLIHGVKAPNSDELSKWNRFVFGRYFGIIESYGTLACTTFRLSVRLLLYELSVMLLLLYHRTIHCTNMRIQVATMSFVWRWTIFIHRTTTTAPVQKSIELISLFKNEFGSV